jgi:hypothetical protein
MKKLIFEERRIYIAEIEYNNTKTASCQVFNAYKERFPEDGLKYDYEILSGETSVCRIYKESCFDFVEK